MYILPAGRERAVAHQYDQFDYGCGSRHAGVEPEHRRQGRAWTLPESFSAAFGRALTSDADPALLAHVLTLPSESYLAEQMTVVDVDGIHAARRWVQRTLAERLREPLLATYQTLHHHERAGYCIDAAAMGRRALKNVCLDYLMQLDDAALRALCLEQFHTAGTMTDQIGALAALVNDDSPARAEALTAFYARWRREALVVDKWLTLQATSRLPGALAVVRELMAHEAFSLRNPNKVRALIGAFSQANPWHFHAADSSGYTFLADRILDLNAFNPQIAARLMAAFTRWRQYEPVRQQGMREQLERILAAPELSPDVYEIAAKSLGCEGGDLAKVAALQNFG